MATGGRYQRGPLVSAASPWSGLLCLPEDLVDVGDGVEQLLALLRGEALLRLAGELGGLPELVVEVRILLQVLGLEVVGPQHPQVVLDQIGPLLLDLHGPLPEDGIVVALVLLLAGLDRLGFDPSLGGVV